MSNVFFTKKGTILFLILVLAMPSIFGNLTFHAKASDDNTEIWNLSAKYTGYNDTRIKMSSEKSAGRAMNALDNNPATGWETVKLQATEQTQLWMAMDLGESRPIEQVLLQFDGAASQSQVDALTFAYSNDTNAFGLLKKGTTTNITPGFGFPFETGAGPYWTKFITDQPPQGTDENGFSSIFNLDSANAVNARYVMFVGTLSATADNNIKISTINFSGPGDPTPQLEIAAPLKETTITTLPLTISGYAARSDGTINAEVFDGTTSLGIAAINPHPTLDNTDEFTLDIAELGEGYHNLKVVSTYNNGKTNNKSVPVKIQTLDPAITALGSSFVQIEPVGVELSPGFPALIEQDKALPELKFFQIGDNIRVTANLISPSGRQTVLLTDEPFEKHAAASTKTLNQKADELGTYIIEFTIKSGTKTIYDKIYLTAATNIAQYAAKDGDGRLTNAYPNVKLGSNGKLVYTPDYKGNTILDYSAAGYKGGGAAIPNVPVKIKLKPLADPAQDALKMIQDAIDAVSALPAASNGFRGAVLLEEGVYRVSDTLKISTSGVVLKGVGDGSANIKSHDIPFGPSNDLGESYFANEQFESGVTKLISTFRTPVYDKSKAIIDIRGSSNSITGSKKYVIDQYVPAGGKVLHLDNVEDLNVGDNVTIKRNINDAWVDELGMYGIPPLEVNRWPVSDMKFHMERTVDSIDKTNKTITLLEPFSDSMDYRWGIAEVSSLTQAGVIENVGVENIQAISSNYLKTRAAVTRYNIPYFYYNDEGHAQTFISMNFVQNAWARNFTTYHLDVGVSAGSVKWATTQDANVLDPISGMDTSERRYTYTYGDAQLMLTQRAFARYPRHAFYVGSLTSGPNVFRDSRSQYNSNASEPHFRWSSGGLYEQITGARTYLQDRWDAGTMHGWAGVNYTLWNNGTIDNPTVFLIGQPTIAPNYAVGLIGERIPFDYSPGNPAARNHPGYEYSLGTHVNPASLYLQQLEDRKGKDAVIAITKETSVPAYIDESTKTNVVK